jgi:outer membrane receptor protein involved in Fe transport
VACKLQNVAAILVALSSFAKPALAESADAPSHLLDRVAAAVPGQVLPYGQAGATVQPLRGWTTSVFVTSFGARPSTDDDALRLRSATFVNGRITHSLTKNTRLSLDVFNLFDKSVAGADYFSSSRLWSYPGAADNFLLHPAEPRGFRLRLRTTF